MSDETKELVTAQVTELSIQEVIKQVEKVQQLMGAIMKPDHHFGIIPGTEKPTLYKAGAEKLNLMFRLAPTYTVERHNLPNGHREYETTCYLKHLGTDQIVGEGVGTCSTMESKYRYRNDYVSTGKPVPKEYWQNRDLSIISGKGFVAKKIDGQWEICKAEGKQENPDIADNYNTVKKVSKKRAYVDATITVCAASDIFNQDLEDFTEEKIETKEPVPTQDDKPGKKTTIDKPPKKTTKKATVTDKEKRKAERDPIIEAIGEVVQRPDFTDDERAEARKAVENAKELPSLKYVLENWTKKLQDREAADIQPPDDEADIDDGSGNDKNTEQELEIF